GIPLLKGFHNLLDCRQLIVVPDPVFQSRLSSLRRKGSDQAKQKCQESRQADCHPFWRPTTSHFVFPFLVGFGPRLLRAYLVATFSCAPRNRRPTTSNPRQAYVITPSSRPKAKM